MNSKIKNANGTEKKPQKENSKEEVSFILIKIIYFQKQFSDISKEHKELKHSLRVQVIK